MSGAGALIAAGGNATAETTVGGTTQASIGDGAILELLAAGGLQVLAESTAAAVSTALIATGSGLVSARAVVSTAVVTAGTLAWIGTGASITTTRIGTPPATSGINPGDVLVRALARAEGDARADSYGGAPVRRRRRR